ncbi:hypothetical protein [Streptomyces sp. NRRL B-1347]|uniref:hypothetical protein n=1 Tax=Streptomyces sp. NRRL B-1347 TaxID=1476877 RepID=UPI0004C596C4|nr:hypothetical protein [Streptomyces sp. NRRL B-1347]
MAEMGGDLDQLGGDERLAREWLGGLTVQPALPASVLARLLTVAELPAHTPIWLTMCSLDRESTAVLVAAPHVDHRMQAAENPHADVDVLARLARNPEPRVRSVYAGLAEDFGRRVPDGVPEVLARDGEAKVRRVVARWNLPMPLRLELRLAEDEDASVRASALTAELWPPPPATSCCGGASPGSRTCPPTWWSDWPPTRTSSSGSPCASRARKRRTHSSWRCAPTGTA